MEMIFWNSLLSILLVVIGYVAVEKFKELKRIEILLNKTREEVAKEYVTKQEVHHDINRVLDRLDRLEAKLDTFMREQRSAIN